MSSCLSVTQSFAHHRQLPSPFQIVRAEILMQRHPIRRAVSWQSLSCRDSAFQKRLCLLAWSHPYTGAPLGEDAPAPLWLLLRQQAVSETFAADLRLLIQPAAVKLCFRPRSLHDSIKYVPYLLLDDAQLSSLAMPHSTRAPEFGPVTS